MNEVNKIVLIKLGEIWLKGKNRSIFINQLVKNICNATNLERKDVTVELGRIYCSGMRQAASDKLRFVFGIHSFVEAYKTGLNIDEAMDTALKIVGDAVKSGATTFKVDTNRSYKKFEKNSMDISKEVGACILNKFGSGLGVNVKNPDFILNIEVREDGIFLYSNKNEIECAGGLPVGTGGNGLTMLSGGIDSPVAAWHMMKRGMRVDAVHFYSPPYTGEKAKEKVIDLCRQLMRWNSGEMKLFLVNFSKIQIETKKAPENVWTLLHRRLMVKIARQVAEKNNYDALISGENLGQVASQTIENIRAIMYDINFPILRPLIGFDKQEIIDIAKKIDTYRISILPYEDCCAIFLSRNPKTKARTDEITVMEEKFADKGLLDDALDKMECVILNNKIHDTQ